MTEVAKLKQLPSAHVAKTKLSEAQKLALETERLARESDVQIPLAQVKRSSIKELLAKTKEKVKQNIELREKLAQVKESPRLTHDRCIGNVLNVNLSESDDDSKDGSDEEDGLVVLKQVAPANVCVAKRRDLVKLDLKERLNGLREREWEEMMEEHKMDNEELSEDGDGGDEDAGFLFGKENEDFEENGEDDEGSSAEESEASVSPSDEQDHDESDDERDDKVDNYSDDSGNESHHSVPSTADTHTQIQSTIPGRKRLLRVVDGLDGDENIVDDNAPSNFTTEVIETSNAEAAEETEHVSTMQPKKSRRIEIEEDEDPIATQQSQVEEVAKQATENIFMSKINAENIHKDRKQDIPVESSYLVGLIESNPSVLSPTANADEKSDEEDDDDETNANEDGDDDEDNEEDQEEIDEADERQNNQAGDETEKAAVISEQKDNDLVQLVDEIEERDKAFLKRITLPAEYRQLVRDGENSESEGEDLMETHVKDLEDLLRPEVATEEDKKMIDKNENIDRKHDKEAVEEHRRWEEQKHMDDMERINSFITADAKDVSELEMIRFSIRRSRRNARFEKMQTGILSESNTVFLSDSEDEAENAESIHRRLKRIRKRMKNANPESIADEGSLLGDDSASNSLLGMIQPAFENENSKSSNGGGTGISFRSEMSPLSSTLGISKAGMFGSYLNKAAKDTRTNKPSNSVGLMKRFVFNCENSSSNHSFKDEEKSPLPGKQSMTSKSPSASHASIGQAPTFSSSELNLFGVLMKTNGKFTK